MRCIFCLSDAAGASTSHVLPASLGGGEWACLPDGLVCSRCNQYFGEKVERHALSSFPFLPFRVMLGLLTRKGKVSQMGTTLGTVAPAGPPGLLAIDAKTLATEEGIKAGRITQMRVLAEPTEPVAVCRMLVKMGLEVVAMDSPADAQSSTFDAARAFARQPVRGSSWWFMLVTDHSALFSRLQKGISETDWADGVSLSVVRVGDVEAFRLQLLDMVMLTPLYRGVVAPEMGGLPEPDHRLFVVQV